MVSPRRYVRSVAARASAARSSGENPSNRGTFEKTSVTIIKDPPLTGEPKRRVDGGERLPTADLPRRRFGEYAAGGEGRGRGEAVVFRIPAEHGDAPEIPGHLAARDRHVRTHVVRLTRNGKEAERDGLDEGILLGTVEDVRRDVKPRRDAGRCHLGHECDEERRELGARDARSRHRFPREGRQVLDLEFQAGRRLLLDHV